MIPDTGTDLASALLNVTPKLLRQLGADLDGDALNAPGWREIVELRATPGQLSLLCVLVEHERCTMQELAEYMTVAPSTATAMVKRLVAQGFIERSRDEVDWRAVWVRPTLAGQRAVQVFQAARLLKLQRLLSCLSEHEREALQAALPALYHLTGEKL